MILKIKYNKSKFKGTFNVKYNDNNYCTGVLIYDPFTYKCKYFFSNDEFIYINFDKEEHKENLKEHPMTEKNNSKLGGINYSYTLQEYNYANRMKIYNKDNKVVGQIRKITITSKSKLLKVYADCYKIDYNNEQYTAYFVPKAFKGIYYFIVNEKEETVAVIKQKTTGSFYNFQYEIYLKEEKYAYIAIVTMSVSDNFKYGGKVDSIETLGSAMYVTSETTLVATPKQIKKYYDKKFINDVLKNK